MRHLRLAVLIAASTLLLAGCGGGDEAQQNAAKKPVEQAVFTSTTDCADSGKLTMDQCVVVIEAAVAQHVAMAPTYGSLRSCEKAEGDDKCERMDEKTYRPMLRAYLVIIAEQPIAIPLYPTKDGKAGFAGPDKTVYFGDDEKLQFSKKAVAAYERHLGAGAGPY
jgi:hypothetical protein